MTMTTRRAAPAAMITTIECVKLKQKIIAGAESSDTGEIVSFSVEHRVL
jgi:hypothetical protein